MPMPEELVLTAGEDSQRFCIRSPADYSVSVDGSVLFIQVHCESNGGAQPHVSIVYHGNGLTNESLVGKTIVIERDFGQPNLGMFAQLIWKDGTGHSLSNVKIQLLESRLKNNTDRHRVEIDADLDNGSKLHLDFRTDLHFETDLERTENAG